MWTGRVGWYDKCERTQRRCARVPVPVSNDDVRSTEIRRGGRDRAIGRRLSTTVSRGYSRDVTSGFFSHLRRLNMFWPRRRSSAETSRSWRLRSTVYSERKWIFRGHSLKTLTVTSVHIPGYITAVYDDNTRHSNLCVVIVIWPSLIRLSWLYYFCYYYNYYRSTSIFVPRDKGRLPLFSPSLSWDNL